MSGSTEPLRDEAVAFTSKLWETGIQAELHVWLRGSHWFSLWIANAERLKRKVLRDIGKG